MSPWRTAGGNNPYSFASMHLFHQARGQGRSGRGRRGKGRGQGPGRHSQAMSDSHVDVVTKRLLSANHLRIKEMQNQLQEMKKQMKVVKDENRLFRQVQHKQERALRRFDDTESQLPQMIQSHNSEVRSLREQIRRYKDKFEKTDRYLRDAEDELEKSHTQMKKYKTLSEQKNLGEREDLDRRLNKVETALEEKNSRISELERHIDMVKKNHRHEMGIERVRAKETLKQIEDMREEKAKLEASIKEKEKQLEAKNIYSNRLNGTPPHSPPLWRQNLNRQSESMTDLSFRDRAKAYEEKRRADAAEKREKEKRAKSLEPKPKVASAEDTKDKDTTSKAENATTKPQREDSEAEFWRRQEERYKQGQANQDKQDEERRRKEEEDARLRAELDKMKRDLEERERAAERERREAEERQRRERERLEEMERKDREAKEREQEREERERKEAEQQAKEKREQEVREREEQENEARLAEERRKKEELMRRLQHMDGSHDQSRSSGDPFALSPTKRKDYTFTQSVENLHKGKPSHDHMSVPVVDRQKKLKSATEDSDIGGYQPSFTGPIKTTAAMKQKKPLSLFDDEPKPAATSAAGGAEKKSRLMADLFGSQASSKKDSDDLFLGDRPAARPQMQNKRAPAFPWNDPPPASSKPREAEKRGTSALFGGGAAVIDDDDSAGHAGNKSTLLPRRPRQAATTFSSKPAVLAVDNFDDDIEEVVL